MTRRLLAACLFACLPLAAQSQSYPTKTVKIIAPVQPGGGVDLTARTVAEQLTKSMGQSFIVENVSGGGGVIASQNVARAAPDGYTLMLGYVATHGTVPAVRKVPYDAVKDFTPIAMVAGTPNVLVVGANVPATDVKSLVDYAKKNKDVVKRLNEEINKAIATPELRQRLSGEALEPMPMTPEQFGKFMQEDIAKWAKLARERNIKLED